MDYERIFGLGFLVLIAIGIIYAKSMKKTDVENCKAPHEHYIEDRGVTCRIDFNPEKLGEFKVSCENGGQQ